MMRLEVGPNGHTALLSSFVRQFHGVKVAVLGDPMLDYYHFGHVDRLSPEAPVPVFIEDKIDLRDGGAGNVAQNLTALGCIVQQHFPSAPYSMKHRYLVGSQQLFRIDNDKDHSNQFELAMVATAGASAAVISDYGKGWCTEKRCQLFIEQCRTFKIPVVVDPKGDDWDKYRGATVICPNSREMRPFTLLSEDCTLLEKRGPDGLRLHGDDPLDFPARARAVFDVTGAGDTVVAVVAAALAIRCELTTAAELANIAAGVVVGQVGTSPISAAALLHELEREP
jgi:D-beta-D-heptose 7-phosphate kinase/D-beta-D-heptose 1-phosphate adenosyltransferase